MLSFYFFSLLGLLLLESISFYGIKLYMVYMPVVGLFVAKRMKIRRFYNYELSLLLFYFFLALTIAFSNNLVLSIRLVVYEIILIFTYLILRYLSQSMDFNKLNNNLLIAGKYYILLSSIYYLAGLYNASSISGTGEELFIYGVMKEHSLIRFRGLADSPNSYILFSSFFLYFFLYKKNIVFSILSLITIVATISSTIIISLLVTFLCYCILEKKIIQFFSFTILGLSILFGGYIYFVANNKVVLKVLQWRLERNSSGTGRFGLWEYALTEKIPEHPFFGYGINQTREVIKDLYQLNSMHNSFMEAFLTSGIIGLFLYSLFICFLFIVSVKLTKKYNTFLFMSLFITFFIVSLANNTLHVVYVVFYMLIIYISYYYHQTKTQ